jgi:chorismate synthase
VAKTLLAHYGVSILAWTSEIGEIKAPDFESPEFSASEIERNEIRMPNAKAAEKAIALISALRKEEDSTGGIVVCRVSGLAAGLGEPVFNKLDAEISRGVISLGAAKGIEFGRGFDAARLKGSTNNDAPLIGETNNCGGVLGGISTGGALEFRAAFKPVPSIGREQRAADKNGAERQIKIKGRHDVCVCPRAVPVVEAMCAIVLADALLSQRCARL